MGLWHPHLDVLDAFYCGTAIVASAADCVPTFIGISMETVILASSGSGKHLHWKAGPPKKEQKMDNCPAESPACGHNHSPKHRQQHHRHADGNYPRVKWPRWPHTPPSPRHLHDGSHRHPTRGMATCLATTPVPPLPLPVAVMCWPRRECILQLVPGAHLTQLWRPARRRGLPTS